MKDQLQRRLDDLRSEYEAGQKMLAELETRQTTLRETLLRIAGAVQVLEEELGQVEAPPDETLAATPENGAPETAP